MGSINTKETILDAASRVILQRGIYHFTLEEVAKAAGVSKGGLLYHFPNKDTLIKEMLAKLIAEAEGNSGGIEENNLTQCPTEKWLLNYIKTSYTATSVNKELATGLLAAIATNKELIEPIKDYFTQRHEKLNQCQDPILATIIRLAADGMRFAKILNLDVLSDEEKEKIATRLVQLLKESNKDINCLHKKKD